MSLVDSRTLHQPISYNSLARAATLPTKSEVFVAQERLQQLTGHLMTSRTTWSKIVDKFVGKNETAGSEFPKLNMPEEAMKAPAADMSKPLGMTSIDKVVEDKKHQLPPWPSPKPVPHKDYVHSNPPEPPTYRKFTVFTAGSIEMGDAVNWQPLMATLLNHLPITVCNPRKGSWDQSITPQAKDELFRQQVVWELGALEQADVICFFFDTETKSPVSLLELGLWAASDKVVVCCGDAYWKSGNVHLTCERYGVPCVKKFTDLVPLIEDMLEKKGMKLDNKGDLIGENMHKLKEKPKKKTQLEAEKTDLQGQAGETTEDVTKISSWLAMVLT
ncbi:hypothetical protein G6011_01439 [Alternaria panax]|uniref:Uncharacterized protein n=1 Tax=Alternaria panax TaxID=48097 RepID=A0AAD4IKW8_9PLEO|nr:hypothetical protein G6011_01439 [Alternaria panax]